MKRTCLFLSIAGVLLTIVEILLQTKGASLCHTSGCKLAASFARSEMAVLGAGLAFFILLSLLFFLEEKKVFFIRPFLNITIISGLAVEGYLVGFQHFVIHKFCAFCLIICGLIYLIAFIYAFSYHQAYPILGIGVFLGVFIITYLVSPPAFSQNLEQLATKHYVRGTPKAKWFLFKEENCPHCKKVLQYLLHEYQGSFDLYVCDAQKCVLFLKKLGINEVPVLLIDKGIKKEILIGDSCIIANLKEKEGRELFAPIFPQEEGGVCGLEEPCQ